jgi:hypothetical protein
MALRPLGNARVFKDSSTGQLVVDKTTIRRHARRPGGDDEAGDDFEGRRRRRRQAARRINEDMEDEDMGRDDWDDEDEDDEYTDDDLGDEDVGDDDLGDDDLGDDDLGDDDLGDGELSADDLGDEVAGPRRRRRRQARRQRRQTRRKSRRSARQGRSTVKWGTTARAGESNTPAAAGDSITITIRPQHWFKSKDITFTGDTSAKIDTIFFGERPVWNNASGVPVSVFSSTGMLRGLLAGQKIRPGLDIIIKGTAGSTTATTATLIGLKPMNKTC